MRVAGYYIALFLVFILVRCSYDEKRMPELELSSNWRFSNSNENAWYKASIPGDIFYNYQQISGVKKSDLGFIKNNNWEFQTSFNLSKDLLNCKNATINLTYYGNCRIYLNDTLLIQNRNQGKSIEVDCKKYLNASENSLKIRFIHPKPGDGIWEPPTIIGWNDLRIIQTSLIQTSFTEKFAEYRAEVIIEADNNIDASINLYLNRKLTKKNQEISILKGTHKYYIKFGVNNPKLWWTNGNGQPNFYSFVLQLNLSGEIVQEYKQNLYIRNLTTVVSGTDSLIYLNKLPLFIKGMVFEPPLYNNSDGIKKMYDQFVDNARKSNVNFVYSPVSDFFGKKYFCDVCEQNGIIFWEGKLFHSFYNTIEEKTSPILFNHSWFCTFDKKKENLKDEQNFKLFMASDKVAANLMDTIQKYYHIPDNISDFVYLLKVFQSERLKTIFEYNRILTKRTGFLFNPVYDSLSNSLSDSEHSLTNEDGTWKQINYTLKNLFTLYTAVPVINGKNTDIYIFNDDIKDFDCILLCRWIDFMGNDYFVKQIPVVVNAKSNLKVLSFNNSEIKGKVSPDKSCLVVQISRPGQTEDQNILYFTHSKNLVLPVAVLKKELNISSKNFNLILKSKVLVKNIVLSTSRKNALFSNNNFDLLPDKKVKISIEYNGSLKELEKDLNIKYLNPTLVKK